MLSIQEEKPRWTKNSRETNTTQTTTTSIKFIYQENIFKKLKESIQLDGYAAMWIHKDDLGLAGQILLNRRRWTLRVGNSFYSKLKDRYVQHALP